MSKTMRGHRGARNFTSNGIRPQAVAGTAAAAAALLTLLAACGGSSSPASSSSGSPASAPSNTAAAASSPSAVATQAAGGSMGCLAGTWTTSNISAPEIKLSGGQGGTLTISGTGAFDIDYADIKPMTFEDNGLKGSMQYRGQATGQLKLDGSKLSGVTQSSTFKVTSQINGHSFSLPLPKVRPGTTAPWIGYTCTGNTLTLIDPPPGGSMTLTRAG
jgi:hypothetical protein